jgi:hypothetical protein
VGLNRKQFKLKRRSCALCKPHKMGWEPRLKSKQRILAKLHRAEVISALG